MKTKRILMVIAAAVLALPIPAVLAQGFNSGSDGSMGALNVTSNTTLSLPPDGVFRFTTVTVQAGRTLSFTRNVLNTPVFLLATGDVIIDGVIDVSGGTGTGSSAGVGGPGGFDGGAPGVAGNPPGDGKGPGAGKGGGDGFDANSAGGAAYFNKAGDPSPNDGLPYGSALLVPVVGGSGGGGQIGGAGGGGGGGALLIASSSRISLSFNGEVRSRGGFGGTFNEGSGGSIRFVAPTVQGTGLIDLSGGNRGALGRVRVDAINRTEVQFRFAPAALGNFSLGGFMTVFPPNDPRLDIIATAGTTIPEGSNSPVVINLPFGSDPNRTVTVQARNFNTVIPIEVVLTPDHGPSLTVQTQINNAAANPATVTVPVTFPVNTPVAVNAWRR